MLLQEGLLRSAALTLAVNVKVGIGSPAVMYLLSAVTVIAFFVIVSVPSVPAVKL